MSTREYTDYMDAARMRQSGADYHEIAEAFGLPEPQGAVHMVWYGEQLLKKEDPRYELPRIVANALIRNNLSNVDELRVALAEGGKLRDRYGPRRLAALRAYLDLPPSDIPPHIQKAIILLEQNGYHVEKPASTTKTPTLTGGLRPR
ncbi:MAG: hypothetical protein CVV05_00945 [Gammaproteobacteria bacterium HGW-Gammaproteobacteria-1]|jgi:hypothetical protein|nr:MAG: hypothetical protein CVV05_00945 [Gammaproteobacteria bacterium HGW-Gammaproteobacteria-1]